LAQEGSIDHPPPLPPAGRWWRADAMEFPFDLAALVGAPPEHQGPCVGYVDDQALRGSAGGGKGGPLSALLEELGKRSAVAQGLRKPVTFGLPASLGDQRVYLLVDGNTALGFLKVGRKRLFVAAATSGFVDVRDAFREIEPLCALDFYVHESCQRSGHGRRLFDAMLQRERTAPAELGYDRPSPKLLAFMKRHFGLTKFQPQSNNFVVYDAYFDPASEAPRKANGGPCDSAIGRGPIGRGAREPFEDALANRRRPIAAAIF